MRISSGNKKKDKKDKKTGEKGFLANFAREGDAKSLLPDSFFFCMAFVALALPNIIFSGPHFFDTLHIMKWVFAMGPIALLAIAGGLRLCAYGARRTDFKLDAFGQLWLVMLLYVTVQPLWVDIKSWSTFYKEWFFFASLVGMYIFSFNLFRGGRYHKAVLWAANVNAALNVVFAELLIREMNAGIPFIMNVPGNYIGNTGQQEMFGLWMAMALMNGLYLHVAGWERGRVKYAGYFKAANIFLAAVNAWGLWNSTTRGAMLSLLVGIVVMGVLVWRTQNDREMFKRMAHIAVAIIAMLIITLAIGRIFEFGRAGALVSKTTDMVSNISSIGGRREIWQTSWLMVKEHAIGGVGIGHYKWHFLDAQRQALREYPDIKWIYTYWAHSEYLQWFAEFGIFGVIFLLVAGGWWLFSFVRAVVQKKALSIESVWASSMLFLIWFDAIFSRPFHRIENVLWAAFAFAIVNKEILPVYLKRFSLRSEAFFRLFGLSMAAAAVAGLFFLGGGLVGDRYLRNSTRTNNIKFQAYRINEARKRPMSRDEAEEQYAYYLISIARATKKRADWNRAIEQLHRSYLIRPKAKELIDLISLAQQLGYRDMLIELLPMVQRPPQPNGAPPASGAAPPPQSAPASQ